MLCSILLTLVWCVDFQNFKMFKISRTYCSLNCRDFETVEKISTFKNSTEIFA